MKKKSKAAYSLGYIGDKKIKSYTSATIEFENGSRMALPLVIVEGTITNMRKRIISSIKSTSKIARMTMEGAKMCNCGELATLLHKKKCFIYKVKGTK